MCQPSVVTHRIWLGRSREIAELESGLDELASRRGSLYVVTGEPGIGKTRLADELARTARARGVCVHWGRAWEAGGAPAYWPFLQVLRSISRDGDPLAAVVAPAHSPIERFQLFEDVAAFLRARSDELRVVVLDDLHAADLSSLELLHFLVRHLCALPLMVIATYRDAEARLEPARMQLLARIAREATALPLRRLERAEVREFVALATGERASEDRVVHLHQQTEGNPLFLGELLRLQGAASPVTDGIREVVRARLALLDAEARRTLEAAAVLGREFAVTPLAALAGISELDVRALVEPAANAGIVEALHQPPRWRFSHVLLRQGLYDDLPDARRRALHAAAADELARHGRVAHAEIAHHLIHAVPHVPAARAARAALRAADAAIESLAFEHARELYGSAERLLADVFEEQRARCEAILGGAHACMRMAEVRAARAECDRAAQLARALDDGGLFARAILLSTYELVPEVRDAALIATLEEALARLPPGDSALRARCLAQLAAQRQPEPDSRERVALAYEAVAMARRLGGVEALRHTLVGATVATTAVAHTNEFIAMNHELLRLSLPAGDKRVALRSHMFLAGACYQRGDVDTAAVHERAVGELVGELRHGRFGWMPVALGVVWPLAQGRFADARRALQTAEAAAAADEARGALFAAAPLAFACVTERYEQRAEIEVRTRTALGPLPHELGGCLCEMLIAQLHGRSGDRRRAQRQLTTVTAHPMFAAIEEPVWLAFVVEACCLAGDRPLAERLYESLVSRAEQFAFLGPLTLCLEPPYSRQVGLLALALGRADEAVDRLESAERRTREIGMRAHLARLWFELSRALIARGRVGDRERAASLVADARELATSLEQVGLLAQMKPPGGMSKASAQMNPAAAIAPARAAPSVSFGRDGDAWLVAYGDRSVVVRDSRGMQLLAQLVAHADQELHVLQLATSTDQPFDVGDAGPQLDAPALAAYRARLLDLRDELADAEQCHDLARTERAREEIEAITGELARAVGLGGRSRRAADASERARTAVQKRLRDAIRKLRDELPELGLHLEHTIYTGTFCGYLPHGRAR
jgi:hypothetical protein